jgi:hypothetical protein
MILCNAPFRESLGVMVGRGRGGGYGLGGLLSPCCVDRRDGNLASKVLGLGALTRIDTTDLYHVGRSSSHLNAYCKHGNIMDFGYRYRCLLVERLPAVYGKRKPATHGRSNFWAVVSQLHLFSTKQSLNNKTRCATPKTAPVRCQEMPSDGTNQLATTVGLSQMPDLWVGTGWAASATGLATWYYASVDSAGMESLVYADMLNNKANSS